MCMLIELDKLDSNDISVREFVTFSDEYTHTDIKRLDEVFVEGIIRKDDYEDIHVNLNISGKMLVEDSISLEDVVYPFTCQIDEVLEETVKNNSKSIDITDILWQNIILEVPLRYTEVKDFSKFQGDGWKLVSEEERRISNNPFKALIDNKEEE